MSTLQSQIDGLPSEVIDIGRLLQDKEKVLKNISLLVESISKDSDTIKTKEETIIKSKKFLNSIDVEELTKKKKIADKLKTTAKSLKKELEGIGKKKNLLSSIPCGSDYPTCRFIKDAHIAVLILLR